MSILTIIIITAAGLFVAFIIVLMLALAKVASRNDEDTDD